MSFKMGSGASRKYALVIGITYKDYQSIPRGSSRYMTYLPGCLLDIERVYEFLTERCGYEAKNIVILCDEPDRIRVPGAEIRAPTRANILYWLDCLIGYSSCGGYGSGGNPSMSRMDGDQLWMSYSGHMTQTPELLKGNEDDGHDENMVPVDYKDHIDDNGNGDGNPALIRDDILFKKVVKVKRRCSLFALFDCCHAGTALDLPVSYNFNYLAHKDRVTVKIDYDKKNTIKHEDCGNVTMIAACSDNQQAVELTHSGEIAGALTAAFVETMRDRVGSNAQRITYMEMIRRVTRKMECVVEKLCIVRPPVAAAPPPPPTGHHHQQQHLVGMHVNGGAVVGNGVPQAQQEEFVMRPQLSTLRPVNVDQYFEL